MEKDFLQSEEWRKFQESVGRKTYILTSPQSSSHQGEVYFGFSASIIEHSLPIVGKYFYIPRGPIVPNPKSEILNPKQIQNSKTQIKNGMDDLIKLAKENKAGWVRFDADSEKTLEMIKNSLKEAIIVKAPHDMQPRQIFIVDISKSEEDILAEMKAKTRYNIRLAEKKGVRILNFQFSSSEISNENTKYINDFLRLTRIMADRQGINPHSDEYYRKMFEIIPSNILKLYVAEYDGRVVAANAMIFYGKTCIYLHGASNDKYKNLMAPYLLQWQTIKDAKKAGCEWYDFGGVKIMNKDQETGVNGQEAQNSKFEISNPKQIQNSNSQSLKGATSYKLQTASQNSWAGITRFKTGFSPKTSPTEFPGSFDIVIDKKRNSFYRLAQKIKNFIK